jgi:hypothetical protein
MPTPRVPEELRKRPFTTAQAARYGLTRTALQSDPWRNLLRNVWVHRDVDDTREMRLDAVGLLLGPDAFICGLTAAWVYGIDVQDRRGELIWVGCRTGHRLRPRDGCQFKEITVSAADLQLVYGAAMTTPLRTAFDCARWLSIVEAVVVADALAHANAITAAELASYLAAHRGLRGVRQVERVIDLMEPKSESPMETRVRLLLIFAGLPRPEAQLVVLDRDGEFVARADLGYRDARLLIEYDGAWHWQQRAADERRREALRDLGWKVLVVTSEDYYRTPERVVAKVRDALAAARA